MKLIKIQKNIISPIKFSPVKKRSSSWHYSPLKIVLLCFLIVAIFAAGFILNARSLVVNTVPEFAKVDINDGFYLPLASRFLLLAGNYTVDVTAPGYYPEKKSFIATHKQNQKLNITLNKTPGVVIFTLQPEKNISVTIDDQANSSAVTSPLNLTAGGHNLRFNAPGYLEKNIFLNVEGKGKVQYVDVSLEPAWAEVQFLSSPTAANVLVDGKLIGKTPLQYNLIQGERKIQLQLENHEIHQQYLSVVAGEVYNTNVIILEPMAAQLLLNTTPDKANITFNGEFKGQSPLRLSVPAEKIHQLTIFKNGFNKFQQSIKLASAEEKSLSLTLKPKLASVSIYTTPVDAELFINGKSAGIGKQALQLPSFQHLIEVRKKGYQSQRRYITPRPGFEQSMTVKLLTEHQARWKNIKPRITSAAGQEFLLFHPHKFVLGASRREAGRRANEILHTVNMQRPFYLSTKEVSNAEFRLFNSNHSSGHVDGNSLDSDQQPVVNISWEQAAAYCNWLSENDSLSPFYKITDKKVTAIDIKSNGYRLPTEAEWAWAARTGKNKPLLKYPWGDQMPPPNNSGNYADNDSAAITGRAIAGYQDGFLVSAAVGSYAVNQKALFDMGGNVAEWVNDFYGLAQLKGLTMTDPTGPKSGDYHVIRGSSWAHGTITQLRLSFRDYGRDARDDLGFRLARYVE